MASKSKKNKVKFKWSKELIFLIVGIVALIIAAIFLNLPSNSAIRLEKYNTAISEYNSANNANAYTLTEDNVYYDITYEDLLKEKKEDKYLYVFYCTLSDADIITNMLTMNTIAKERNIDKIYLWYATYVSEAAEDDKNTLKYKEYLSGIEKNINGNIQYENVSQFDMEVYPTLLVFKNDCLVFNSQTYSVQENNDKSSEYTWMNYFYKAIGLSQTDAKEIGE